MKWFETGLSQESLNKKYRTLVKQYHPDVNDSSEATAIMAEINAEYDKYFVQLRYTETGYNADEIHDIYSRARKHREIVLAFLRRDKKEGNGFFALNRNGKIVSDGGESWKDFHGGFAVCQLDITSERFLFSDIVLEQKAKRLDIEPLCPNYADMYFGLHYGEFESESTEMADPSNRVQEHAHMDEYKKYYLVHSKYYGDIWIAPEPSTCRRNGYYGVQYQPSQWYAYMKVPDHLRKTFTIMRCRFGLKKEFYQVKEEVLGIDFGYLVFQDCTREEFLRYHDVDFTPEFADALEMNRLEEKDLYWIDDPVVAHFARAGILRFYQSKRNFKMRYGSFYLTGLDSKIHELSIDDAERIQDYLDDLNGNFEDGAKSMIKKGKLKIDVSQRANSLFRYRYP